MPKDSATQPSSRRLTLRKSERLYERKAIEDVFDNGRSINERPIRLLWITKPSEKGDVKAAFTVPRKNFKRAVDRNLLKRRMREAYRKSKINMSDVFTKKQLECSIMFIYTNNKIATYAEIESKIVLTLQRLTEKAGDK